MITPSTRKGQNITASTELYLRLTVILYVKKAPNAYKIAARIR